MRSHIVEALAVTYAPIAILLTDDKPVKGSQFKPGKFGCVAAMLLTATKGRTVFFDRETFGCPGGGVGLGFGDCYTRMHFPIDRLLSTGGTAPLPNGQTYDMHEGGRFHRSPEVTKRWLAESALVTLAGFERGAVETATAPWGAACHSIAYALAKAERPQPRGVIGFFDISHRHQVGRDILSFTAPFALHVEMECAVPGSFFSTEPWIKLRERS